MTNRVKVLLGLLVVVSLLVLGSRLGIGRHNNADKLGEATRVAVQVAAELERARQTATPATTAPAPATPEWKEGIREVSKKHFVWVKSQRDGDWFEIYKDRYIVPKTESVVGHGNSYLARFNHGGVLQEVYEKYCLAWDDKKFECSDKRDVVVRTRWIKPDMIVRLIYGAQVRLNGEPVIEAVGWNAQTPTALADIRDPQWQPKHIEREFESVDELRQFAQANGAWIVIGSPAGAPLWGARHPKQAVFAVNHAGKRFYAFESAKDEKAKNAPGCMAMPTHVSYRYLMPGVGHDSEYCFGGLSIFGFEAGKDARDMNNVRLVILSRGEAYYYGTPEPGYKLEVVL